MNETPTQNIAKAYLARNENAWEKVDAAIKADVNKGWEIILELINQADNNKDLMYIAAGPLEDIICKHPDQIIERVIERARQNKRFRFLKIAQQALSGSASLHSNCLFLLHFMLYHPIKATSPSAGRCAK
ncbi:MAG: hypothetical protein GW939_02830 [Candidatus Magasanikbacteria bacterium]|nr:hypothetical protein [Candidatus Magasanikbacteria bacterium]